MITVVDDSNFVCENFANWLWVTFTRSNPANDVYGINSEYKNKLSKKYEGNKNVIFLGKIPHKDLPSLMNKYTYHINATPEGFYDKSVLEAISNGLFSLYANKDYDKHFKKDMQFLTKFELNQRSLADVLNSVYEQEDKNILKIIEYSQLSVSNESIQTIFERIVATVES